MRYATVENGEIRRLQDDEKVFNAQGGWRRASTLDSLQSRAEKQAFGAYEIVRRKEGSGPVRVSGPLLVLEGDVVAEVTTYREWTTEESAAITNARIDSLAEQEDVGRLFLSTFRALFAIAKQINPSVTPAQFKTFVDNATADTAIGGAAFKEWIRDQVE